MSGLSRNCIVAAVAVKATMETVVSDLEVTLEALASVDAPAAIR
jgi:hypothetical protein